MTIRSPPRITSCGSIESIFPWRVMFFARGRVMALSISPRMRSSSPAIDQLADSAMALRTLSCDSRSAVRTKGLWRFGSRE